MHIVVNLHSHHDIIFSVQLNICCHDSFYNTNENTSGIKNEENYVNVRLLVCMCVRVLVC